MGHVTKYSPLIYTFNFVWHARNSVICKCFLFATSESSTIKNARSMFVCCYNKLVDAKTVLFSRERARRASRDLKREKNDTSGGGRVSEVNGILCDAVR